DRQWSEAFARDAVHPGRARLVEPALGLQLFLRLADAGVARHEARVDDDAVVDGVARVVAVPVWEADLADAGALDRHAARGLRRRIDDAGVRRAIADGAGAAIGVDVALGGTEAVDADVTSARALALVLALGVLRVDLACAVDAGVAGRAGRLGVA